MYTVTNPRTRKRYYFAPRNAHRAYALAAKLGTTVEQDQDPNGYRAERLVDARRESRVRY